jgi:Fe-S-cluster containining protein
VNAQETIVPCRGCTACCRDNPGIFLHPDEGDDIGSYEAVADDNPVTGDTTHRLAVKENGDCVYLGPQGCTIYDRRPVICRTFDCRKALLRFPKRVTRQMIDRGHFSQATAEAAKARVHTLSSEERRLCIAKRNDFVQRGCAP